MTLLALEVFLSLIPTSPSGLIVNYRQPSPAERPTFIGQHLEMRPSREECLRLIENGVTTTANSDISGIGVLVAFHISAYVTFTAVLIAYALGIIDDELLSPVDRKVFRITSRTKRFPRSHIALRQFILTLSDNQIVTGIAILAAGFRGLVKGDISVYHYQVVLYLAWLSSSVHLSAISLLRPHLTQHYGLKTWRLVGMLVLLIMLLVGLVPTISSQWGIANPEDPDNPDLVESASSGWGVPAVCFWGRTYVEGVNSDAPLGYAILILSYVWKCGDMYTGPRKLYHRTIRLPVEAFMERCLSAVAKRYTKRRSCVYMLTFRLLLMVILPCLVMLETLVSFSASLWLSVLGLVFGTLQVVIPRNQNLASTAGTEDEWGFGQLVPLVLLIQPLGVLIENAIVPPTKSRKAGRDEDSDYELEQVQVQSSLQQNNLSPPRASTATRQSHEPLVSALAERRVPTPTDPDSFEAEPSDFYTIMMSSRLFALLVASLHAGILAGAILIFWINAESIGLERGGNWVLLVIAVIIYVMSSWTLVAFLGPFSRLWKG